MARAPHDASAGAGPESRGTQASAASPDIRLPHSADTLSRILPEEARSLAEPENREALAQAEVLFLRGQLREAEAGFLHLRKNAPHHPGLNMRLGEIYYRQNRLPEAAKALIAAAPYRPQDASLYNTLGYIMLRQNAPHDARKHFLHALGIRPEYFEAWMGLGACNCALGMMRQAMHSYERAVASHPNAAEAWNNLGVAANAVQDPKKARDAFAHAIDVNPDYARAHAGRASTLLMLGHPQEAEAEAAQAMALAPEDAEIFYTLSTIRRFRPDDADLVRMAARAEHEPLRDEDAVALHFALGKAFEDCGDIERAFDHMQKANAARRAQIDYDEAAHLTEMQQCRDIFTAEVMAAPGGQISDLPVFIVGMPRTGSSLLEQMLDCHPAISGAGERADFGTCAAGGYAPGLAVRMPPSFEQTGAAYLARMHQLAPHARRIIDKRLENFRFLGTIHRALPGARILHIRRNPEDCALSCFRTRFNGQVSYTYDLAEMGRYYRAYEQLMAHWHTVLPQHVLLDVVYEDLVQKPEETLHTILDFLGQPWNPACLSFFENMRPVQTASAADVRQPLYVRAIGRSRGYAKYLAPFRDARAGAA